MNKKLYNDKELFDDADLDWYDYGFRNYDAQIGRFTQLDPLTWDYPELTNYQYASDEPIANVDMDGLEQVDALAGFAGHAANQLPDVVVKSTAKVATNTSSKLFVNLTSLSINTGKIALNQATVKAYTPGAMERWSNSPSFLGKLSYSLADDIYVTAQTFRDKANKQHLGGGHVNNNESVKSFGNTLTYVMPIGGVEAGVAERGLAGALKTGENALVETASGILKPGGNIIGKAGSNASIREFSGGMKAAQSYWSRLVTSGAKPVLGSSYKGMLMELPNGGRVGFRTIMTRSSGTAATIDVNIPGLFQGVN